MVLQGLGGQTHWGQAHKSRMVGGNVRHAHCASAVRRKAQSRRAAREMDKDVAEPIRTSVKVSSLAPQLTERETDRSQYLS